LSAKNKPEQQKQYIFGPGPSRRLGLSLGVDIVPFKTCPLDCVYCQLGRTTDKLTVRKDYTPVDKVVNQLKQRLDKGVKADFVTISGSGEPTLHSRMGELIDKIKAITQIPIAVLTNAVLFDDPSVRADCSKADVVLPSLDAADQQTFERINRPCTDISIKNIITGLCRFREQFNGQIWLEVFIVEGLNTGPEQIAHLRSAIERIRPDKVQLNTAVRPTADLDVASVTQERLRQIASELSDRAEVVADFTAPGHDKYITATADDILEMLRRRPCSMDDICRGLGLRPNEVVKHIDLLRKRAVIDTVETAGVMFFKSVD
jgi:wyosine [tRNA(Phe)-imidazoG37] synthetase (radical SAM superfamily)